MTSCCVVDVGDTVINVVDIFAVWLEARDKSVGLLVCVGAGRRVSAGDRVVGVAALQPSPDRSWTPRHSSATGPGASTRKSIKRDSVYVTEDATRRDATPARDDDGATHAQRSYSCSSRAGVWRNWTWLHPVLLRRVSINSTPTKPVNTFELFRSAICIG